MPGFHEAGGRVHFRAAHGFLIPARAVDGAIAALNVPHFSVASVKADAAGGPFPARCVVDGTVATDGDGAGPNSARLRVQLPETWNGKLVFFGVGGLA